MRLVVERDRQYGLIGYLEGKERMDIASAYVRKWRGNAEALPIAVHCALRAAEYHRLRTIAIGLDRQGDVLRWISGGELMHPLILIADESSNGLCLEASVDNAVFLLSTDTSLKTQNHGSKRPVLDGEQK